MLILRHAESEWNRVFGVTRIDAGIFDPGITHEGAEAARASAEELRGVALTQIVSSPYRRTLQTAAILADALQLPVSVEPLVRERCAFSCDQGSSPRQLAREWPHLDFAHLDERWWGTTIESMESLRERAMQFLERARSFREPAGVLIVSHWGFIRCISGAEVGNLVATRLTF